MALSRTHGWPQGHWTWPIPVTHKHGLRCGEMVFVGGQVDMDAQGRVLHPHDLATQTQAAVLNIDRVLATLGADLADAVKFVAFYVNDGGVDETAFLADLARHLPEAAAPPVVTAVPLPALAYPGMAVEIEAIAMRGLDGRRLPREAAAAAGFSAGLRCGEMIFVGGQSAVDAAGRTQAPGDIVRQSDLVMERIGAILATFGADHDDVVKINNYYVGGGVFEDWEEAARMRAISPSPARRPPACRCRATRWTGSSPAPR